MIDVQSIAPSLRMADDGIWYGHDGSELSYPESGNQTCYQVEESSFWFRHRNDCIAAVTQKFPPPNNAPIFDIGGGNGFVSLALTRAGFNAVLVEPGPVGAKNGKRRGLSTVVCATTSAAGFLDGSMGAVGLFDVLEHIDDDVAFVASMRRLLTTGGRLYATVPACAVLWSHEDTSAGHFRRHSQRSVRELIGNSGFAVDYVTSIFRPLPLPIFLMRALPYRLGLTSEVDGGKNAAREHNPARGGVNTLLDLMLRTEITNIVDGRSMKFGSTCLLVATAF